MIFLGGVSQPPASFVQGRIDIHPVAAWPPTIPLVETMTFRAKSSATHVPAARTVSASPFGPSNDDVSQARRAAARGER